MIGGDDSNTNACLLAEDFANLSEELGFGRIEIPWANATRHAHWSTYYCAETKALVESFYAEDFERFGYSTEIERP